jgi:hypothetical protein
VCWLRRPRAFWIALCNLVGLTLSLSGVLLLFYFALPPTVPGGPTFLIGDEGVSPGWDTEVSRYQQNARLGLLLVVLGTLLEGVPPFAAALLTMRRRAYKGAPLSKIDDSSLTARALDKLPRKAGE